LLTNYNDNDNDNVMFFVFNCNSIMTYGVAKLRNREFRIALILKKDKMSVGVYLSVIAIGAWVGVHGSKKFISQKSFKTYGKHILDNLRDKKIKKTHQQRLRGSGGAAPSGGRGQSPPA